jgi:hypothetical protein
MLCSNGSNNTQGIKDIVGNSSLVLRNDSHFGGLEG